MAQSVLKANGKVVPRRTVRRLKPEEIENEVEAQKRIDFDIRIQEQFVDSMSLSKQEDESIELDEQDFIHEPDSTEDQTDDIIIADEDPVDKNGELIFENPTMDVLIDTECNLPLANGKR